MSQAALQILVGTALTDSQFCAELLDGKRRTLLLAFEFTDEERRFIQAVQAGCLQEFAARLDEWLQAQRYDPPGYRAKGERDITTIRK
jgi:hypothetical protein